MTGKRSAVQICQSSLPRPVFSGLFFCFLWRFPSPILPSRLRFSRRSGCRAFGPLVLPTGKWSASPRSPRLHHPALPDFPHTLGPLFAVPLCRCLPPPSVFPAVWLSRLRAAGLADRKMVGFAQEPSAPSSFPRFLLNASVALFISVPLKTFPCPFSPSYNWLNSSLLSYSLCPSWNKDLFVIGLYSGT